MLKKQVEVQDTLIHCSSKEFFVIGEGTAGGMDCWLVYSAYTEEIGFVEKEALVDIS